MENRPMCSPLWCTWKRCASSLFFNSLTDHKVWHVFCVHLDKNVTADVLPTNATSPIWPRTILYRPPRNHNGCPDCDILRQCLMCLYNSIPLLCIDIIICQADIPQGHADQSSNHNTPNKITPHAFTRLVKTAAYMSKVCLYMMECGTSWEDRYYGELPVLGYSFKWNCFS